MRAAADIFQEEALGFDTETRPAFRKGESHPPALAQVATARTVWTPWAFSSWRKRRKQPC